MSYRDDDELDWDQKPVEDKKPVTLDANLAYSEGCLSTLRAFEALLIDRVATFNARSKDSALEYEMQVRAGDKKEAYQEVLDYARKAIEAIQGTPVATGEEIR